MKRLLLILITVLAIVPAASVPVASQDATPVSLGWAHPEWLADAAWLQEHLDDDDVAIIALTSLEDFVAGHVPGAAQIDLPALAIVETGDESVATWRSDIEPALASLGIERDDTVVIYDGGTFYAARLWWVLFQLGHQDIRILDGGLEAWTAAGGDVEAGTSTVEPADEPYVGEPNEEAIAQIDEVERAFEAGDALFVDARRADEYAEGHIPGAVNVPETDNADESSPAFWKQPEELRALYEGKGVTPDSQVITYCASGVRSAVTYFALLQLGFPEVTLFTGSFNEWSSDPNRPVATGDQP